MTIGPMTLILHTSATVNVSAWKMTEDALHLQIGMQSTILSKEEAAKVAEYLAAFAAPAPAE